MNLTDILFSHKKGLSFILFKFEKFVEILAELLRREKAANIKPDPDIDVYMKVKYSITLFMC